MMTPTGLAIFYGGLARQKNAVNTLHMVFITTGVIAAQFTLIGYSLAFGPDAGGYGFIGTLDWAGLNNVLHDVPSNAYGGIDGYDDTTSDLYDISNDVRNNYSCFNSSCASRKNEI